MIGIYNTPTKKQKRKKKCIIYWLLQVQVNAFILISGGCLKQRHAIKGWQEKDFHHVCVLSLAHFGRTESHWFVKKIRKALNKSPMMYCRWRMKNNSVAILLQKTENYISERDVPLTRTQSAGSLDSSASLLHIIIKKKNVFIAIK